MVLGFFVNHYLNFYRRSPEGTWWVMALREAFREELMFHCRHTSDSPDLLNVVPYLYIPIVQGSCQDVKLVKITGMRSISKGL